MINSSVVGGGAAPANLSDHPKYRPDIDGLRTIAVGFVILYHFFPNYLQGGFIGVDIFFVISGFLISTIIINQMLRGSWSYSGFYVRRINRIFPALALVLGVNLVLGWYTLVPDEYDSLGKQVTTSAAFIANFGFWSEAGYFDRAAESKPLLHMWSLAIEEQFYILWPIILALFLKFGRRYFWHGVTALTLASLIYSSIVATTDPTAAYYSPLSRFFELAVGGLLAYAMRGGLALKTNRGNVVGLVGLAMLCMGAVIISDRTPFPGYWALLPTLGTAALILAGPQAFVGKYLLSFRPMVWIGLISYPLYLWHWPVLVWTKLLTMNGNISVTVRLALIILAVCLAAITYILIEKPIKRRNTRNTAIALAGIMLVIALIGSAFWSDMLKNRLSSEELNLVVAAGNDWTYPSENMKTEARFLDYRFYKLSGSETSKILFMGDSNIEQYAPRIEALVADMEVAPTVIFATKGGCRFAIPALAQTQRDCRDKLKTVDDLIQDPAVNTIVMGQQWLNSKDMLTDSVAFHSFEKRMASLPAGKRKFLILNMPLGEGYGPADQLEGSRFGELRLKPIRYRDKSVALQQLSALNAKIKEVALRYNVTVIDPFDTLCSNEGCEVIDAKGHPLYKDREHLTASYVREHAVFIDQVLSHEKP